MSKAKKSKSTPVERASLDIVAEQIERLKEIFPEAVTEGKVDFERLKATLGEIVDDRPERYSFSWAGKRDAIRLLQVPSRATLKPCVEESKEELFICRNAAVTDERAANLAYSKG